MKIEESLNMTFDETPPHSKTSPLVDDDLNKEEAIKFTEKKNLENDIEDETLKINDVVNIKESRNHPLENVIGNLNQRTLRSSLSRPCPDAVARFLTPSPDRSRWRRFMPASPSPRTVCINLQEIWCSKDKHIFVCKEEKEMVEVVLVVHFWSLGGCTCFLKERPQSYGAFIKLIKALDVVRNGVPKMTCLLSSSLMSRITKSTGNILDWFNESFYVIPALMVVESEVLNDFPRFVGILIAEFFAGDAVNHALKMKGDMIIKKLDLKPTIDAMMRDFL
nr:hypothetical protein CTI12_AA182560 [Tanacetum cinerariifolium]